MKSKFSLKLFCPSSHWSKLTDSRSEDTDWGIFMSADSYFFFFLEFSNRLFFTEAHFRPSWEVCQSVCVSVSLPFTISATLAPLQEKFVFIHMWRHFLLLLLKIKSCHKQLCFINGVLNYFSWR